jgi:glycosyl transferase family 4
MTETRKQAQRSPNVLAVSFYYPPANNPRAVQVARLLEHVNLSTLLVCGDDYASDDRIDRALSPLAENLAAHCLRVPFAQATWKRLTAKIAYQFHIRLWEKAPDRYLDWKPAVLRAVRGWVEERDYRPDLIVTFGTPMSDHLIGMELKEKYDAPWIAHFSDPWIENPFKNYNWLTRAMNLSLERKVVAAADRLIYTSDESVDLVLSKYPDRHKQKARVLSHAFDPRLYLSTSPNGTSPIIIRYVGDMYGQRTPAPLFRALGAIANTNAELLNGVKFEFVGSMSDFDVKEIGFDQLPAGLVTFRSTVDYVQSLSLMSSADGLLVIDAPAKTSVFLPSKLVDYVGAGRPVMGITPPGTAAKLIGNLGGWIADPADTAAVELELRLFISYLRNNKRNHTMWGDAVVRQRFEANSVAENFQNIVAELL